MLGFLLFIVIVGGAGYFIWKRIQTRRAEREARTGGTIGGSKRDRKDTNLL